MTPTTDPIDPKTRELLRKAGAPEWYPQEAPRHETSSTYDGRVVKFVCPTCGYIRHVVVATRETAIVNKGDPWASHSGVTAPEIFGLINLEIQNSLSSGLADHLFSFLNGNDEGA